MKLEVKKLTLTLIFISLISLSSAQVSDNKLRLSYFVTITAFKQHPKFNLDLSESNRIRPGLGLMLIGKKFDHSLSIREVWMKRDSWKVVDNGITTAGLETKNKSLSLRYELGVNPNKKLLANCQLAMGVVYEYLQSIRAPKIATSPERRKTQNNIYVELTPRYKINFSEQYFMNISLPLKLLRQSYISNFIDDPQLQNSLRTMKSSDSTWFPDIFEIRLDFGLNKD